MTDGTVDKGEFVIYQAQDGIPEIAVRLEKESLWLNQQQLAELFDTDRTSIVKHMRNILETGELAEQATCAFFAQVRTEGKRTVTRNIAYYNLDMILSVGYRVNSKRGTQFRIWANRILKDHLVKGYTLNKRIAASLFLYFLDKNGLLYGNSGHPSISNEGLASMTLMIAESRPEEMETIKRVLLSLLNRRTL